MTVENLLDIELDMEGLSEMVDAVGGIIVTSDLDWYDDGYYKKGYHYQRGEISLDGPDAMGYLRMRHLDSDGDLGRTERQRKIIEAIVDKGANIALVNKIGDMVDVLGDNMAINMNFEDMKNLLLNYAGVRKSTVSYMMAGQGPTIDGIYYLLVSEKEIAKVHGMISNVKF